MHCLLSVSNVRHVMFVSSSRYFRALYRTLYMTIVKSFINFLDFFSWNASLCVKFLLIFLTSKVYILYQSLFSRCNNLCIWYVNLCLKKIDRYNM